MFCKERQKMICELRERYSFTDECVLAAMEKIPRYLYIPAEFREAAKPYGDHPSSIGNGQTMSQPYIVAYMTKEMNLLKGEKVLEIGTGSGYQSAVLAELGIMVYSVEIVPNLAEHAMAVLESEGYGNVRIRIGDGYQGWPEYAPYDAIIVTCAPADIPGVLVEQLAEGGRMIMPIGESDQKLMILRKNGGKVTCEEDFPVRFVPMVHGRKT